MASATLTKTQARGLAAGERAEAARAGYIATRGYDALLFIFAPFVALVVVEILARLPGARDSRTILGVEAAPLAFLIAVWTYAHLFAVVFRSHANPQVFAQFPLRFVIVPVALFVAFVASDWLIVSGVVLAVLWDVYHTSKQNFGFCRLYDMRAGNPPEMGRRIDVWLNHVLYVGPILAGASLIPTLTAFRHFRFVGWRAPIHTVNGLTPWLPVFTWSVVIGGVCFVLYYLYAYRRLIADGYRLSWQKTALLFSTGTTSILAWGFFEPWKAFFVANFFHGLQYFAIVWWTEKKNIQRVFGLDPGRRSSLILGGAGFLLVIFLVGTANELYDDYTTLRWTASLFTVVALMHFWYDGFIWSVRKHQVT
jgi:hypothetical protein